MGAENFKVKEVARVSDVLLNLASEMGLVTTTLHHLALRSLDQTQGTLHLLIHLSEIISGVYWSVKSWREVVQRPSSLGFSFKLRTVMLSLPEI